MKILKTHFETMEENLHYMSAKCSWEEKGAVVRQFH